MDDLPPTQAPLVPAYPPAQAGATPLAAPSIAQPDASTVEPSLPPPGPCAACGVLLQGVYCHACGQKAMESAHFSVHHLVGEFLKEATSFDGKLWSTARLMVTRPGQLVVDYLQGRGRLYVSPVKLYLTATAIYFLLFPYAILDIPDLEQFAQLIQHPTLEPFLAKMRVDMASGAFYSSYQNWYTLLLACTVVLSALVLKLGFRHRLLGEHLVFALNELTFVFLMVLPLAVIRPFTKGWQEVGALVTLVLILAWGIYVALSIRRVYRPSRRKLVLFMLGYLVFRQVLDSSLALAAIVLAVA